MSTIANSRETADCAPSAIDFDAALTDPSRHFDTPDQVLDAAGLEPEQRLRLLRQWELDERLMSVATEENMEGDGGTLLADVHQALTRLREDHPELEDEEGASTSKIGG